MTTHQGVSTGEDAQRDSSASALVHAVLDSAQIFGGHSDAHDDLTMLAARLV